jgi:hypothetical protein
VSALALLAAAPEDSRAQQPISSFHQWNFWVEGGGTWALGPQPGLAGIGSTGVQIGQPGVGGEGALGFDLRIDPVWHLWGQFRFSHNKIASRPNSPKATFLVSTDGSIFSPVAVKGTGSISGSEDHWLADFMVGRELNLGRGVNQVQLGFRMASISELTNGSSTFNVPVDLFFPAGHPPTAVDLNGYSQNMDFFGIGPRVAMAGSVPITGAWWFDYDTGVAVLFGPRQYSQTVFVSGANINPCIGGCPINLSNSNTATVFNFDVEPGISYFFTPNIKLSANYRFDGYWDAARLADASGTFVNGSRIFQGGFLRVSFGY